MRTTISEKTLNELLPKASSNVWKTIKQIENSGTYSDLQTKVLVELYPVLAHIAERVQTMISTLGQNHMSDRATSAISEMPEVWNEEADDLKMQMMRITFKLAELGRNEMLKVLREDANLIHVIESLNTEDSLRPLPSAKKFMPDPTSTFWLHTQNHLILNKKLPKRLKKHINKMTKGLAQLLEIEFFKHENTGLDYILREPGHAKPIKQALKSLIRNEGDQAFTTIKNTFISPHEITNRMRVKLKEAHITAKSLPFPTQHSGYWKVMKNAKPQHSIETLIDGLFPAKEYTEQQFESDTANLLAKVDCEIKDTLLQPAKTELLRRLKRSEFDDMIFTVLMETAQQGYHATRGILENKENLEKAIIAAVQRVKSKKHPSQNDIQQNTQVLNDILPADKHPCWKVSKTVDKNKGFTTEEVDTFATNFIDALNYFTIEIKDNMNFPKSCEASNILMGILETWEDEHTERMRTLDIMVKITALGRQETITLLSDPFKLINTLESYTNQHRIEPYPTTANSCPRNNRDWERAAKHLAKHGASHKTTDKIIEQLTRVLDTILLKKDYDALGYVLNKEERANLLANIVLEHVVNQEKEEVEALFTSETQLIDEIKASLEHDDDTTNMNITDKNKSFWDIIKLEAQEASQEEIEAEFEKLTDYSYEQHIVDFKNTCWAIIGHIRQLMLSRNDITTFAAADFKDLAVHTAYECINKGYKATQEVLSDNIKMSILLKQKAKHIAQNKREAVIEIPEENHEFWQVLNEYQESDNDKQQQMLASGSRTEDILKRNIYIIKSSIDRGLTLITENMLADSEEGGISVTTQLIDTCFDIICADGFKSAKNHLCDIESLHQILLNAIESESKH